MFGNGNRQKTHMEAACGLVYQTPASHKPNQTVTGRFVSGQLVPGLLVPGQLVDGRFVPRQLVPGEREKEREMDFRKSVFFMSEIMFFFLILLF